MKTNYTDKKVIVRAYGAGVFYGTLKEKDGQTVVLTDARRIFHWNDATECIELAEAGCDMSSRLTRPASEIMIEQVLEVHPCTKLAIATLDAIAVWKSR